MTSHTCFPLTTVVLALLVSWSHPVGASVFFTEYIEGSSSNKAVEIFNGSGQAIDLSAYSVHIFSNGNPTPSATIPLVNGVLTDGEMHVLVHTNASEALKNFADQTSGVLNFNGNDAVGLLLNGALVDVLGEIGFNPGAAWTSGVVSTANRTLVRNSTILTGDSVGTDSFDPSIEWTAFDIDTFDGLGYHALVPEPSVSFILSIGALVFLTRRRVASTASFY